MVSLAEHPGTGYELSQQFDASIGHFWSTSHQQIYRTLRRLETEGLISVENVSQEGKPDKKIYSLAPAGQQALKEWIEAPTPLPELRDDLGVKLRGAHHSDPETFILRMREHRDSHAEKLTLFQHYRATQFPDPDHLRGRKLHQYLVLLGGIRGEEGFIEWCDEVIRRLAEDRGERP